MQELTSVDERVREIIAVHHGEDLLKTIFAIIATKRGTGQQIAVKNSCRKPERSVKVFASTAEEKDINVQNAQKNVACQWDVGGEDLFHALVHLHAVAQGLHIQGHLLSGIIIATDVLTRLSAVQIEVEIDEILPSKKTVRKVPVEALSNSKKAEIKEVTIVKDHVSVETSDPYLVSLQKSKRMQDVRLDVRKILLSLHRLYIMKKEPSAINLEVLVKIRVAK